MGQGAPEKGVTEEDVQGNGLLRARVCVAQPEVEGGAGGEQVASVPR